MTEVLSQRKERDMYQFTGDDTVKRTGRMARNVLKLMGIFASAASAATVIDGQVGKRLWPSAKTQLIGMDPQAELITLAFAGLGSLGVVEQAQAIRRIVPGEVVYWDYSTDHISIQELATTLKGQTSTLKRVNINGHSMGGPFGLEVVRRANIPELKLGHIILHCSPFDMSDTRHKTATAFSEVCRWPTGPAGKFTFSVIRSVLEGEPLSAGLNRARFDAVNGCSPRLWLSQLRELRTIKLEKHLEDYKKLVDEETKVWYCMPDDPLQDKTVKTEQASERYGEFFAKLGVPYRVWRIPEVGHADVPRACSFIETALVAEQASAVASATVQIKQTGTLDS